MFCKNCGTKNREEARFCKKCGTKLSAGQAKEVLSPQSQPSVPPPIGANEKKTPSSKKTLLIIIAIVLVFLLLAVLFFFGVRFLLGRSGDKKKMGQAPTPIVTAAPTPTANKPSVAPTLIPAATFTAEELTGSWISERFQDGTYWVLEFRSPEYMAQEIVFFTGESVPTFESIPGLWNSGAWSDLDGSVYSSLFSLDGSVLTLGDFDLGGSYRLEKIDENTMHLDDGSGSSIFGTMRRFSRGN